MLGGWVIGSMGLGIGSLIFGIWSKVLNLSGLPYTCSSVLHAKSIGNFGLVFSKMSRIVLNS